MRFRAAGNGRLNGAARPPAGTPAANDPQMRIFGLLTTDTSYWLREWADWRVRFGIDNARAGMSYDEIAEFVDTTTVPLCCWAAEAIDEVLYLQSYEDVKAIFRYFGSMTGRRGEIAGVQHHGAYLEAARLAVQLAGIARSPESLADEDAQDLPDVIWSVAGVGPARVATALVKGHRILVRRGYAGVTEMWLVDVDGTPGCGQWRSRADAMSKLGVGMAIRIAETHRRSGR